MDPWERPHVQKINFFAWMFLYLAVTYGLIFATSC